MNTRRQCQTSMCGGLWQCMGFSETTLHFLLASSFAAVHFEGVCDVVSNVAAMAPFALPRHICRVAIDVSGHWSFAHSSILHWLDWLISAASSTVRITRPPPFSVVDGVKVVAFWTGKPTGFPGRGWLQPWFVYTGQIAGVQCGVGRTCEHPW